ncbi:hypothetical protein THAOC_09916 [Thalassiosira oceanica]|uniref:Uncharacterized protein n=1 Tax=Thalassiosira oceanica TaxID=159749 RepID=K0T6C6_THAOC|nr:hypothetical protein THAOC_09916 [Thalassiosira oceanica]|eukprot:EJK68871.1 hypothetical protein THAOC_09916 [Thalassiosira oceanica]
MSSTVAPPKPPASHLQLLLPHCHPPTASLVLGRANGRARAVAWRRHRPPAASTPGSPRERALGIDPLDRSGRDKRQRAPLEGDRMAIPIGFYIGARPEPAVVHLPSSVVGWPTPPTSRLPSYDSTCSLSKLTFLLDSIIVNWTQNNYYLVPPVGPLNVLSFLNQRKSILKLISLHFYLGCSVVPVARLPQFSQQPTSRSRLSASTPKLAFGCIEL